MSLCNAKIECLYNGFIIRLKEAWVNLKVCDIGDRASLQL